MKLRNCLLIFTILSINFAEDTFPTAIGNCTLNLYDGQQIRNQNLQKLVITDLFELTLKFGMVESKPFEIFITNNLAEFNSLAIGPVPEWGIAAARENPDRIIIKGPRLSKMSYSRLQEVLSHELNHIYFFRKQGTAYVPRWFSEGFATDWANEFNLQEKILISSALWEKRNFSLEALRHFGQFHREHARLAYAQSAAAIEAMRYYYGDEIIAGLLNGMKNQPDFDSLFYKLTNDDGPEFLIKFESFLNENYRWIFLLKTSNLLFVFMPVLLITGFLIKRRRSRITLEKWKQEEALMDDDAES